MRDTTDVLVIGSGFGGAISAAGVAEAGFTVKLLERGPWRDTAPVKSMGVPDRAPLPQGWRALTGLIRTLRIPMLPRGSITLSKRGFFDVFVAKNLTILTTSNVGGGSHAYGALNMRPPGPGYWDAAGLSDELMERHYENVAARLGSKLPKLENVGNPLQELFKGSSLLAADDSVLAAPMGLLFPKDPANPTTVITDDGVTRWEVRPGEEGTLGSAGGGKSTLDFVYLHPAMRKHGLKVLDLVEAISIAVAGTESSGRFRVTAHNLKTGDIEHHYANHVFVAAGTMNTLELLLRSREANGLKGMPQLGKRFYTNGDLIAFCSLKDGAITRPSIPVDGIVKTRAGVAPLGNRPWPLLVALTLPSDELPLPAFMKRIMRRQFMIAGMGKDAGGGEVYLKNNKLIIDYEPSRSPIYEDIRRAHIEVAKEIGGKLAGGKRPTTAHPMGGACVGRSTEDGVIDCYGEVFDCPGLYVTDAAALPGPLGGPPSLTIGAWADYVAGNFVVRHKGN